ncbi:MAG: 2-succinyl-5-enolpyruvyl-6-hydroxy-3-cyclohexene-1-carboxylic-acid synthase [Bacteroidales bacterium]|nr:2-succinyl-5-enolpyruvyl-6-hydroxy-3-cyclohexene-1-carboxylic-acid synthase [Bacteroidales bacterium]
MLTNKYSVNQMVAILAKHGLRNAIISPGSRNAPITLAFSAHKQIDCLSIVDERSAGFFALGIAQQSGIPVALVCTSGTALLNYAPALAEAYYQGVPLIAITADRPTEWIDQMEGQSIRQANIFNNYVKASFQFMQEPDNESGRRYNARITSEAFNMASGDNKGPVHINVPLQEPLYELTTDSFPEVNPIESVSFEKKLSEQVNRTLASDWNKYERKLILTGMNPFNKELNQLLERIADLDTVVVLTERTSNLHSERFMDCTDRIISSIDEIEIKDFKPDLLITIGRDVVSKKVKAFLRLNKPQEHWHIDSERNHLDTYQSLTRNIQVKPSVFFRDILPLLENRESGYYDLWKKKDELTEIRHQEFISSCMYSDLLVFNSLMKNIPEASQVQLANSTPVRYAQLIKPLKCLKYHSNRGTSGIDGAVSTAAGSAYISNEIVTLICGDIGFLYDSNGLWNNHLSKYLRVIVINNGGGGIFRFIDGPSDTEDIDTFFVTPHHVDIQKLVHAFGVKHYLCEDIEMLEQKLQKIYQPQQSAVVLEIKTPDQSNAQVLRNYFNHLKQ